MPKEMHHLRLVEDVSEKGTVCAWLFNFDVDSAELKTGHKDWLDSNVIAVINVSQVEGLEKLKWKVFVLGATSRTASFSHNQKLSERRANSVKSHIVKKCPGKAFEISVIGFNEFPAIVAGRKDEIENALDRKVLVVMTSEVKQISRKIKPPRKETHLEIPCCYALQCAALSLAAYNSWLEAMDAAVPGNTYRGDGIGYAQPDRIWATSMLKTYGYSSDRAWEIYESHPWFRAPENKINDQFKFLYNEITRSAKMLNECVDMKHDLCSNSTIAFGRDLYKHQIERIKTELHVRTKFMKGPFYYPEPRRPAK